MSHLGISHEKHRAEILYPGFQAQAGQVHLQKQSLSDTSERKDFLQEIPIHSLGMGSLSCLLSWEIKQNVNEG